MTGWILNAVEKWAFAQSYWTEREIGAVLAAKAGRLDALLVPLSWNCPMLTRAKRFALAGVEVKASRADFLKGIRTGQFERYRDDDEIAGLYVATPKDVCKTKELPQGVGHLVMKRIAGEGLTCICRSHPTFSDSKASARALWIVIQRMHEAHKREMYILQSQCKEKTYAIGDAARDAIFSGIRAFEERLELLASGGDDES